MGSKRGKLRGNSGTLMILCVSQSAIGKAIKNYECIMKKAGRLVYYLK
jgi:hypothetical protein